MSGATTATMVAFHGKTEVKDKYLQRVRAHRVADELVRGQYWGKGDDGIFRGCAVGCTLHSGKHGDYETELGIPRILARLEDGIFEGLPWDRAMSWPEEFLATPQVGADLSLVWPQFALWLMVDAQYGVIRFAKSNQSREAIQAVADAYGEVVAGRKVSATKWREIHRNAAAAAAAAFAATFAFAAAFAAAAAADADAAAFAAADAFAAAAAADAADAATFAAAADADAAAADAADAAAAAAAATTFAARHKVRVAQADKLLELMAAAQVVDTTTQVVGA